MSGKLALGVRYIALAFALSAALFLWGYITHRTGGFPSAEIESALSFVPQFTGSASELNPSLAMAITTPYAMGSPISDPDEASGVTVYVKDRSFFGYNLFNSKDSPHVKLINMKGDIVFEWFIDGAKLLQHMELDGDGCLYAIDEGRRLIKLDKESNIVWTYDDAVHHDMDITKDGLIYVLTRESVSEPGINFGREALQDSIAILSPSGKLLKKVRVIDIVRNSRYSFLLPTVDVYEADLFHANSIEVFDGSLAHLDGTLYKKGNMLLSLRNMDMVCIYDPEAGDIVWAWGPENIFKQHHASVLENGDIIFFDNGMRASRVLEVSPGTDEVVWSYGAPLNEYFFSSTKGSAQRLPNGNTLISIADEGYAVEVTPDGETVWKFVNPDTYEENSVPHRYAMYRMTRLSPEFVKPLMQPRGL